MADGRWGSCTDSSGLGQPDGETVPLLHGWQHPAGNNQMGDEIELRLLPAGDVQAVVDLSDHNRSAIFMSTGRLRGTRYLAVC